MSSKTTYDTSSPTVTRPGPGISIPFKNITTISKQPSNTPNPEQKPTPALAQDPCAPLKATSSATYAFCRKQYSLPVAVGGGVAV